MFGYNNESKFFFLLIFFFTDIEAECQDDYMKIRIGFNGSFAGLLYSSGNFTKQTELILGKLYVLNRITANCSDKTLGILEFVLASDRFYCIKQHASK
jgi:hypothetical protein